MSVGEVLGEAFELYKRYFVRFVGTAAIMYIILDLISALTDRAANSSGLEV